jgi:hypothetical protein
MIEDLHWADRSTLDLLSFVARNLGSLRVMVIGTYRSDEMRRTHALRPVLAELTRLPHVVRIDLQPMNEGEVVQLFTAIRGNQPQPGELDSIIARSEGNPMSRSYSPLTTHWSRGCPAFATSWQRAWTTCPSRHGKGGAAHVELRPRVSAEVSAAMPHSVRDIPVTSELAPYRTYATPSRSRVQQPGRVPDLPGQRSCPGRGPHTCWTGVRGSQGLPRSYRRLDPHRKRRGNAAAGSLARGRRDDQPGAQRCRRRR